MTKKKYISFSLLSLSLLYLLVFISFYILDYLPSVRLLEVSDAVYYTVTTLASLVEYCLPILAAATGFALFAGDLKKSAIASLVLAAPRLFYLLPYYYLYEIAYGNNSLESLGLSSLITLVMVIALTIHIFLLILIMHFVTLFVRARQLAPKHRPGKQNKDERQMLRRQAWQELSEQIEHKALYDLSVPVTAGIFSAALLDFIYLLVLEVINAVKYLSEYSGSYTLEEIGLMAASFLFILLKLILAHTLAVTFKDLTCKAIKK